MADRQILDFTDDLHAEARSVLAHSPDPQDAFEVAIVLDTMGYTDESARALGSVDLFDLAGRVYARCDLYAVAAADGGGPGGRDGGGGGGGDGPSEPPRAPLALLLLRGLLYSVPWLFALVALVVSRVSFWSTITTIQFTSTVTLALFIALILTGGFTQAFARRGTFYALQGNYSLLRWITRWTLGGAAVAALVVYGSLYVLLEWGLRAYTPVSTRMFVFFGLAITAMLLSLAPLYMTRAFGALVVVTGAGAAFLVVAGRLVTKGQYINPYAAMRVQLVAIGIVVVGALLADMLVLRRVVERFRDPLIDVVHPPRAGAVARSVGGYAAYGSCFFLLIVVDQLVAGGLWEGRFVYNGRYELAVGVGLLVLVATFTYVIAVGERFPAVVRDALARHPIHQVQGLRGELVSFYRRHLAVLSVVGPAAAGALLLLVDWLAGFSSLLPRPAGSVDGLLGGALAGYVLLSVGAMNSGLLFALARPAVPALSAATGSVVSLFAGGLVGWLWEREVGAVLGLVAGTALFAVATTVSTWRAFRTFDTTYYRAF